MWDVCTKLYLLLHGSITADQNSVLKLVVLQHDGQRRTDCLQQGNGINTAPGALQACGQLTDTLETLKSWTENSVGYGVGKTGREQKPCSLQPRSRVKWKADGAEEKVPATMKEPCPGPDLHLAPGSFGELPHLVARGEISRKGRKGEPGKEEETGESLGGGVQPFPKLGWRHQIWGGISPIPQWMGKTQHLARPSAVPGRLWAKMLHALNFGGKGEWWVQISPCNLREEVGWKVGYSAWKE